MSGGDERYPSRAASAANSQVVVPGNRPNMPAKDNACDLPAVAQCELGDSSGCLADVEHSLESLAAEKGGQDTEINLDRLHIAYFGADSAACPLATIEESSRDNSIMRDDSFPAKRKWSMACHSPAKFPDIHEAPAIKWAGTGVKFCEDLPTRTDGEASPFPILRTQSGASITSRIAPGENSMSRKGEGSTSRKGDASSMSRKLKSWKQKSLRQGTFKGMFSFKNKMENKYGFGQQTMQRITNFHLRADDVTVGEKIGEGCIGEVFLGNVASMPDRALAIKKLRKDLGPGAEEVEGLTAELRVLSKSLKHPNIVEFVGLCLKENALLIVMELMEGGSLEDHFATRQTSDHNPIREPLATVCSWSVGLLEGLAYLHEKNPPLIHRDLKPGNLMLSGDRKSVKIADFGLAKSVEALSKQNRGGRREERGGRAEGDAESEADTEEHRSPEEHAPSGRHPSQTAIVGTPRYIPPEVWGRTGAATEKVDIYAAALVIWGMVEGTRPWNTLSGDVAATMAKTCDRPPMNPKRFPARLSKLLSDGWAMEPESRPSARKMLEDLQPLKEEEEAKMEALTSMSGSFSRAAASCIPFRGCGFGSPIRGPKRSCAS